MDAGCDKCGTFLGFAESKATGRCQYCRAEHGEADGPHVDDATDVVILRRVVCHMKDAIVGLCELLSNSQR